VKIVKVKAHRQSHADSHYSWDVDMDVIGYLAGVVAYVTIARFRGNQRIRKDVVLCLSMT
jgi:hypothetical protein